MQGNESPEQTPRSQATPKFCEALFNQKTSNLKESPELHEEVLWFSWLVTGNSFPPSTAELQKLQPKLGMIEGGVQARMCAVYTDTYERM